MDNNIKDKTEYCLNCINKPCSKFGCPLHNNIPEFIKCVKENKYKEAYKILSETTIMPGVCGKICPHDKQCEGKCIRGLKENPVEIGNIESYIFEKAIENNYNLKQFKREDKTLKNKKVAIIGSGPAGLTCAAFLAMQNIEVTIFEKYDYLGGLLIHGIPDFRLDRKIIKETIDRILDLGIEVKYNQKLGDNLKLEDLEKKYDAIFIAIGSNVSKMMNVEGKDLEGVWGGNELLEKKNFPDVKEKIVSVIGGGNVAIDVAMTIKKLRSKKCKCNLQTK